MVAIIILTGLFFLGMAISNSEKKATQRKIEKVKAEQARQREELNRQKTEAREWTRKQIELEREQIRQARELEKHEAWLKKHDEEIAKLTFKISQAESDIGHWKEQIGNLYALLDVAQNELEQSIVGGRNQTKYQKQIITLNNQIHSAESRLAKAKFEKATAKRKIEEVA